MVFSSYILFGSGQKTNINYPIQGYQGNHAVLRPTYQKSRVDGDVREAQPDKNARIPPCRMIR